MTRPTAHLHRRSAILVLGLIVAPAAGAGTVRLANRTIETSKQTAVRAADFERAGDVVLVEFAQSPTPSQIGRLEQSGAAILGYVPPSTLLVRAVESARGRLRQLPEIVWLGTLEPKDKLSPDLTDHLLAERSGEVVAELFRDADPIEAGRRLSARGLRLEQIQESAGVKRLHLSIQDLGEATILASDSAVQWIEPAPRATFRNDRTAGVIQSNIDGVTSIWDRGLHGEGEIIGHIDGRIDIGNCYFSDPSHPDPGPDHRKMVGFRTQPGQGIDIHGTHTAGIAAGLRSDGMLTEAGMAYGARLSHTSVPNSFEFDLYEFLGLARADGAFIHTNSYGDDATTAYTVWARDIDRFSYDFEDQLVAFAITNQATLKTPENAKDILAVAATGQAPAQDAFCSGGRGPTADGRRKPEIMAPGCGILSSGAGTPCGLRSVTGTSMACPAIAGGAALARQYYRSGYAPSGLPIPQDAVIPSGALLRATLLNAGTDVLGLPGFPGSVEGWGRLFLDSALAFFGETRGLRFWDLRNAGGLQTGDLRTYRIAVANSAEPLKITLAFTDPPGTPNAASPVVNDLDLEVSGPGGTFLGNVFTGGVSVTGGVSDPLDTVEMVLLQTPAAGTYTLTVRGRSVLAGPQGYGLVATGGFASLAVSLLPESVSSQPFAFSLGVTFPDGFESLERFHLFYNGAEITDLLLSYLASNPGALQITGHTATVHIPGLVLPSGTHGFLVEVGDDRGRIGVGYRSYQIP